MRASQALTALVASILSIGPTVAAAQTDYTEIPLLASDGQRRDLFATAVASTDDYVAVGAPVDDRYCCRPGFVYVFSRDDWTQLAQLQALDPVWGQFFGFAVAASGDTILVGAFTAAPSGIYRGGAAYVFVRDGTGAWSQQAKLVASDVSSEALFGYSVALDGNTAVVGAYGDSGYTGAAYVFRRSGGVWTEEAKLTPPPPASYAAFGLSVAVEGETAVIGAPTFRLDLHGSVHVFERQNGGWSHAAVLAASDAVPFDAFGYSVDLSSNSLVAGAPYRDDFAGAAYAFVRSGTGWVQEARLVSPGTRVVGDYYGFKIGIHGSTAAIGAPFEGYDHGAVYVFGRAETGWDARLRLTPSDPLPDKFGSALVVAERAVVVGAYAWPGPGTPNEYTGKAYVYLRPPTASELAAELVAFVDTSIAAGTLVGTGRGASAPNRLGVVRHHIVAASAFIDRGKSAPACSHLINAYRKMDGTAHAFAVGPAAGETRDRIIELRATLECR
jgi:hypothetical protein